MKEKRKPLMIGVLIVIVLSLSGIGCYYWYNGVHYVSTEDAKITGDLIKVTVQASGKLLEFNAEEGDTVKKGQILGRVEAVDVDEANLDTSLIRAPITGLVVKKQATVGELESSAAAPTLAMIVDPNKLYISANIEETKVGKIKAGQIVDVSIDQFDGVKFAGKVKFIGEAANSAFALISASTGGTFTKVVQKVPVKIELDKGKYDILPGTNAVIKIHIK